MPLDPSTMGATLRRMRRKRGLSQAELADRAGLSRESVSRIEAGHYDPALSTIVALAKALRVKASRLLE